MKFHSSSLLLLLVGFSDAWMTPLTKSNSPLQQSHRAATTTTKTTRIAFSPSPQSTTDKCATTTATSTTSILTPMENEAAAVVTPLSSNTMLGAMSAALISFAAITASPEAASAAVVTTTTDAITASSTIVTAGGVVTSALFAYGHYFCIIGIVAILMTERWTLENGPNLTDDEENRLAIADTMYGAIGLLVVYTGYYRLSDPTLGKGTEFYIHEPIFWLKMAMVGVLGGASLFNTTKIIQRSVARFSGDKVAEPMSEALCNRMKTICNAQLHGIIFIPMAATFMARGIGYNESIPWQAEAGVSALLVLGLGFKYVNEALTFEQRLQEKEKDNNNLVS